MDEQDRRDEHQLRKERVVRWDKYRIEYFTYTNNIFIGLNLGFIGFFITQAGIVFICPPAIAILQGLTLLFLLASFVTGTFLVVKRLQNFRLTSRLTKRRKTNFELQQRLKHGIDGKNLQVEIHQLKTKTDTLGEVTWKLLSWQIWTFIIGCVLGITFITIISNI